MILSMIRKLAIYLVFLITLNGCINLAMLGPAVTYTQSGNVMQSALSYGSNQVFKKIKSRSTNKNKKNTLDDNNIPNNDYSFSLTKKK